MSKRWLFTQFEPVPDWKKKMRENHAFGYGVVALETCPTTQRPHLQGYVEVTQRKRMTAMKTLWVKAGLMGLPCHWTIAIGTAEQNKKYCRKTREEDEVPNADVEEWGSPSRQGKRSDLLDCYARMQEGATSSEIRDEFTGTHCRHQRWIVETIEDLAQQKELKRRKTTATERVLKNWQDTIRLRLLGQDSRKVMWVWEDDGHVGKTWLANYLQDVHNAFVVTGGKWADIAFAYNRERVVVFDLTRTQEESCPYKVMEDFCNGRLFSPKYHSKCKVFEPPKVVVFTNFRPDKSKLSEDRWDIHHIINVL